MTVEDHLRFVLASHDVPWRQRSSRIVETLRLVRIHELLEREGVVVGYTTLRRYMKHSGMVKQRRVPNIDTAGAEQARQRLLSSEVRSYEATHVHGRFCRECGQAQG